MSRSNILSCASCLILAGVAGVQAAEPNGAAPSDAKQANAGEGGGAESLAEVVVTAQKRMQSLQDVPISVTALAGGELEARGVQGLSEYTRLVPGLAYADFGAGGQRNTRALIIRGVEAAGSEFSAPSVGYYLDEAPISAVDTRLFDLDHIEVLRGPQGTLYGVGTAGGTIKLITNQPKIDQFEALAEVTGTSVAHSGDPGARLNALVNIPIVAEKAALRVSAYYRNEPGYIDSIVAPAGSPSFVVDNTSAVARKDFNDQKIWGVRASLLFQPNDRVSITPSVYIEDGTIGGEPVFAPQNAGDLRIVREVDTRQSISFRFYSLTGKFDLGLGELTAVVSHQSNGFEGREDFTDLIRDIFPVDQRPAPFPIDDRRERTTYEVRLASQGDQRLQWLVGAFYENRKSDLFQYVTVPGLDAITPEDVPGDIVAAYTDHPNIDEYAAFGELTYNVTSRFHATAGLRYFDVSQKDDSIFDGFLFNGHSTQATRAKEHGVRPKVQLDYAVTPDVLMYTTASQGFRLGGSSPEVADTPSCRAGLAQLGLDYPVPSSYKADSLWNYEVGTKSRWFDRKLVVNASAYYIKRSDIVQSIPIPGDCGFSVTLNSGKASSKGFEFEANAQVTRHLNLELALGYTRAQLDTTDPSNPTAAAGDRILQVPEWTIAASAEYRQPLAADMEGFLRSDYQYIGNRANDFVEENNPDHFLPGYGTVGLRIGVERNSWSTTLFVDNLLDNRPRLSLWTFGHNYNTYYTMQPRTLGVTVRKKF